IAAEHLERVFAPFAQADESITRRFGGTGLGLAICREIVALLGGELTVQSELGVGSTFAVTIDPGDLSGVPPYEARHAADLLPRRKVKTHDQQKPLPPCSVLLVEDGETNRKLIGLLLRRAGATVTTAENGRDGVEVALHQPFDVVLMDMQMPVMD